MRSYVTMVKTNIKGSSEELRNRPEWRGGASLSWKPSDRLEVMLNALFVGTVRDFAVPVGETKLDPYARVDLAVSWKIDSMLETYLAIENLFDESYEEVVGFPAQGFSARIGLRFER